MLAFARKRAAHLESTHADALEGRASHPTLNAGSLTARSAGLWPVKVDRKQFELAAQHRRQRPRRQPRGATTVQAENISAKRGTMWHHVSDNGEGMSDE